MALLEKLSGSCQREKINAWPSSPGDGDPPPPLLSSLPISFTPLPLSSHHPHTANNGMSHANETLSNRIILNANAHVHLVKSCFVDTLLAFCYSGKTQRGALRSLLIIPFEDVFLIYRSGWYDEAHEHPAVYHLKNPIHFHLLKDTLFLSEA